VPGNNFLREKVKKSEKNAKKKTCFYKGNQSNPFGAISEKGRFSALPRLFPGFIREKQAFFPRL